MILGATLRLRDSFTNVMQRAHQATVRQTQANRTVQTSTTGVQRSLTSLNAQLRVHQSELRESMSRLDGNRNSLEALRTRSESYTRQLNVHNQRVQQLARRYREMAAAHGEESAQATRAAAALARARAQQASMERQIRETTQQIREQSTAWNRMQRDFNDARDGTPTNRFEAMQGAGAAVTGVGMAGAVGLGAMLQSSSELVMEQGKLQASLGLTRQEAENLGSMARDVWKQGFGENVGEATQALLQVRKNMNVVDSEIVKATSSAMTIAQVFDQDVNEITAAAGVMMKNFGINGQAAMDLITVGFQKGGDFSGELLDTMREYSPQFKSLGLQADQAMAMLIAGTQAGAWNLDKVGDSMGEFNKRAQDGSKTTMEGFQAVGLNAGEMGRAIAQGGESAQRAFLATVTALAGMKDPLKQNQAGVALFGTQWEDVRSGVITALAQGAKGLDNFQGATDAATRAIQENNPLLPIIKAMRSMREAIAPAVTPVADILNNTIVPALKTASEWFGNLSPGMQKTIIIAAAMTTGFALVAGPILLLIGFLPMMAAGFTMLSGPVGLVILALAGVTAAGVALMLNWDKVKAKAGDIWDSISNAFKSGVNKAIGWINSLIDVINKIPGVEMDKVNKLAIKNTSTSYNPMAHGHASGLPYVPYDNYLALLHKGEAVLTRVAADRYREQQLMPANISKPRDLVQVIKQKLLPAQMPTVPDTYQDIYHRPIQFDREIPALQDKDYPVLLRQLDNKTETNYRKDKGNNFSIAKLADTLIVREEADIDKITDLLERKLLMIADNMGYAG